MLKDFVRSSSSIEDASSRADSLAQYLDGLIQNLDVASCGSINNGLYELITHWDVLKPNLVSLFSQDRTSHLLVKLVAFMTLGA